MKNYLRTQITLYEEDKKEEASMRCSLLHGSWDQILQRRPSVHLSVTTFSLFLSSYHHEIFSNYHWQKWCPCKKSRSEVKGQGQWDQKKFYPNLGFSGPKLYFWIHRWLRNYAQSLKWHRRRALFKVILQISRSHRTKTSSFFTRIERFWSVTPVQIHQWFWNDVQSFKYHR